MNIPEFATVADIVVICYLVGMGVKSSPLDDKWIPLIVGVFGGVLGVVGMLTMPDFPANNYIDAVAVGIASGLAATGTHQIGKQLFGGLEDEDGIDEWAEAERRYDGED